MVDLWTRGGEDLPADDRLGFCLQTLLDGIGFV
jgi:hypothetical protein